MSEKTAETEAFFGAFCRQAGLAVGTEYSVVSFGDSPAMKVTPSQCGNWHLSPLWGEVWVRGIWWGGGAPVSQPPPHKGEGSAWGPCFLPALPAGLRWGRHQRGLIPRRR
jgi:hypothetical protein